MCMTKSRWLVDYLIELTCFQSEYKLPRAKCPFSQIQTNLFDLKVYRLKGSVFNMFKSSDYPTRALPLEVQTCHAIFVHQ